MADLARRNHLHWDAILGAEVAGDYKPKPRVYLASAEAFNLTPAECMMVAAHSGDLAAAAQLGLKTAHVARPDVSLDHGRVGVRATNRRKTGHHSGRTGAWKRSDPLLKI